MGVDTNSNSGIFLFNMLLKGVPKAPQEPSSRLVLVAIAKLLVTLKIFLGSPLGSLLATTLRKATCGIVIEQSTVAVVDLVTPLIERIFRVVVLSGALGHQYKVIFDSKSLVQKMVITIIPFFLDNRCLGLEP